MLGVVVLVLAIMALRDPGRPSDVKPAAGQASSRSSTPVTQISPATSAPSTRTDSARSSSAPSTRSSSAPAPGSSSSATTGGDAVSAAKQVPLIVLNNTSTTGLAAGAEARFEAAGWTVTHIDSLHDNIATTCAYYDPADAGAKQAAEELQREFPTIKQVEPRLSDLPQGPVVVVLTWDYQAG